MNTIRDQFKLRENTVVEIHSAAAFRASHPNESYTSNVYRPWTLDLGAIVTLRN